MQPRRVVARLCGPGVEGAAQPAGLEGLGVVLHAGRLPDLHRAEVRAVRVGIAHPLHDREAPALEELRHPSHRGMQADLGCDLVQLARGKPQRPAPAVVAVDSVRDDGVQAVVAPQKLHDDQDSFVRFRVPRGRGRATQKGRDRRRAHRDQRAVTRATCSRIGGGSSSWRNALDPEQKVGSTRADTRATSGSAAPLRGQRQHR